jgi:hypothetical protein
VSRVSVPRLVALADGMPLRDRQIVETIGRLSLVRGGQLINLFFYDISNPSTRTRRARRVLARLVEQRVLDRLERRCGGPGGGSSSWVYALGPAGRRMLAYWAGDGLPRSRSAYEPGAVWTAHALAVSDLYVRLREAERAGRAELLAFDAEPACWRRYTRLGGGAGVLKPDAYVQLGLGEWVDSAFIEVDLGTEHHGQLLRKHQVYGEYFRAGVEQAASGVYPAVVWIAPDSQRVALLSEIHQGLPEQTRRLFTVVSVERAIDVLCDPDDAGGAS